jgi:hypothetical protein
LFERVLREFGAQDLDDDLEPEARARWASDAGLHDLLASPETVKAMEDFVRAVPELEPAWRAHLEESGEPLPHTFFGDVSRFAVYVSEGGDEPLRERFSTAIEQLAASDNPDVVEVIGTSFVEDLVWGDERGVRALAHLRSTFGPATRQRIAELEGWAPKEAPCGDGVQRDQA